MENQELIKRLKRWQMAKNPCVFTLHCRNTANTHPDIFSTLEPREVNGKVILFCPDCDYSQEDIPKFVLEALEAKVIPHPYAVEALPEEIEEFSELSEEAIKVQTRKMVDKIGLRGRDRIKMELQFREGLMQAAEEYKKLKKVQNLSNAEKISRVHQWQQKSDNINDYEMRCYNMTCSNVLTFSQLKPEERNGQVVLVCPDCGYVQERIPDYVLLESEQ